MDFLSCVGLIPYHVSEIYLSILDKLFDKISRDTGLSKIYSLVLMSVGSGSDKESYVVGTIFQYSRGTYEYLTNWDLSIYKPLYHPVKYLFIQTRKNLGKVLKNIGNDLHKKRKEIQKKTCACFGEKKNRICIFSTLPKFTYTIGYLSMAIKCHSGSICVKTEELVRDILEILRHPFLELFNVLFSNDIVFINSYMKIVDSCIVDKISELVSRYEIVFSNNIDLQRLIRIYYTGFSGGSLGYSL